MCATVNYSNPQQLFGAFREFRKDLNSWRLLTPTVGEVNGLPGSRGTLMAAGGVLCAIVRRDERGKETLFFGHLRYFVADEPEKLDPEVDDAIKKAAGTKKQKKTESEIIEELKDLI